MKTEESKTDQSLEPQTIPTAKITEKTLSPGGIRKEDAIVVDTDETNAKTQRLFFTIVAIIFVVIIIGVIFGLLISRDAKDTASKTNPPAGINKITATSLLDYANVCNGAVITNISPTKATVRPIAFFDEVTTNSSQYSRSDVVLEDKTWEADYAKYTATQLVGCLTRIKETKSGILCDLTDDNNKDQKVSVYNVTYRLSVRDAETGQILGTKTIDASTTTCPYFATYTLDNPKIYAVPDKATLSRAVKEYVVQD
jgi:hypothetical protein